MTVMAYISDTAANTLNVVLALLLFLVAPVIITLAYKYNQRMDAAAKNKAAAKALPEGAAAAAEVIEPAEASDDEEDEE